MTSRCHFECTACGCRIITRAAIGHSSYQFFAFPCPECSVELAFGMRIDPPRDWEYTDFKNVSPIDPDESVKYSFDLDPECLVRRDISHTPGPQLTPWMQTLRFVRDIAEYDEYRNTRLHAIKNIWPSLERAFAFLGTSNKESLIRELDELGFGLANRDSLEEAYVRTIEASETFGALFAPDLIENRQFAYAQVMTACSNSWSVVEELISFYKQDDRADSLFKQLRSVAKEWSRLYPALSGLDIIPFFRDPAPDVSTDYTLAQKRFTEFKGLYVDCYETLCRISVIAAAMDGILNTGNLVIIGRKKNLTVQDFERMPNGSKPGILQNQPSGHLFTPGMDHKLRNGIGHHSAHYAAKDDTVHYENMSKSRGIEKFSISYVDFCMKTADLARLLDAASFYAYWLWMNTKGIAWKRP